MDASLLACNQESATFGQHQHQHQHQSTSKSAPILRSPTPSQTHSRTNPHTPTSSPHPTKPTYTHYNHNHNHNQSQPTCGILRSPKPVKPALAKSHSESCFFSPSRLLSLPSRFSSQADSSDPDQSLLVAQPSPSLFANPPFTLQSPSFNHSSTGTTSLLSPQPTTTAATTTSSLASHEDLCAGEEVCSIFTRPMITQSLVSPSPRSRMPNSNTGNTGSSINNNSLFHSPMPSSASTAIRRIDFGTPSIPSSIPDSSSTAIPTSTSTSSTSFLLASPVKKAHAAKQHLQKLKIAPVDSCLGYEYESSSSPTSESAAGLSPGQFVSLPENERPVDCDRDLDQQQSLRGYQYYDNDDGQEREQKQQQQQQKQRYLSDEHDEVQTKLLSCSPPCRDLHPLMFESRIRVSSPFSHTFLSWSPAPEEENQVCRPVRAFSSSSFAMGVGSGALHFD